jgi:HSP20 family protein
MTKLIRREPFVEDLLDFRKEFDKIFNRFFTTPWLMEPIPYLEAFVPPVESFLDTKTKKFFLRVALPGVDPSDLKINVQGNILAITGERKLEKELKELEYLHKEMHYGNFERTLTLPEGLETEKLVAEYKNGVLELNAPVTTAALPRRVEIKYVPEVRRVAA